MIKKVYKIGELISIWLERYMQYREGRKLDIVGRFFIDNFLLPQYDPINELEYE